MTADAQSPVAVGLGEVLWDLLPGGPQMGGAPANFAFHARALGAEGLLVSQVGDDALGQQILDRLRAAGVDASHVTVDAEHPTGTVTVELGADGVPAFTIHEDVAWDFVPWSPDLEVLVDRCDALCLGSLAQRSPVTRRTARQALARVPAGCLRVFDVNLRQSFYDRETLDVLLASADIIKLNDDELAILARLLGLAGDENGQLADLLARHPIQVVALTRGPRGSLLLHRGGERSDHPGIAGVRIADTVGAGDAFTAALVMGLLRERPLDAINDAANRIAAHVCEQAGGMPELPEALRRLL